MKHHTFEEGLKYRPDYEWPEPGTEKKCPKCQRELELVENSPSYYGKHGGATNVNGSFQRRTLLKWIQARKNKHFLSQADIRQLSSN